ncbi:MAG: hypothetical protein KIT14_12420 [bacterium]|nr:hypothetical protein [bacterium]
MTVGNRWIRKKALRGIATWMLPLCVAALDPTAALATHCGGDHCWILPADQETTPQACCEVVRNLSTNAILPFACVLVNGQGSFVGGGGGCPLMIFNSGNGQCQGGHSNIVGDHDINLKPLPPIDYTAYCAQGDGVVCRLCYASFAAGYSMVSQLTFSTPSDPNPSSGLSGIWSKIGAPSTLTSLVRLPHNPALYERVGGRQRHAPGWSNHEDGNHWGTPAMKAALEHLSQSWLGTDPDGYVCGSHGKFAINDISLEPGGIFDIDGNWFTPHKYHGRGRAVDIRPQRQNSNFGVPVGEENPFCTLARHAGFTKACLEIPRNDNSYPTGTDCSPRSLCEPSTIKHWHLEL